MSTDSPSSFSAYHVGQVVGAVSARLESKTTTPPPRYDQASLLDDMVNASKFARTPAERRLLQEGLGTSRTRINIITRLLNGGQIQTRRVKKRHEICSTPFARELLPELPPELLDVATTARWEFALSKIESGDYDWRDVVDRGYTFVEAVVAKAKERKAARGGARSTAPAVAKGGRR